MNPCQGWSTAYCKSENFRCKIFFVVDGNYENKYYEN